MKTTKKELTQAAMQRIKIQFTQAQVCGWLRFSEDEISEMMFEQGCIFLEEYFKDTPAMGRMMKTDKVFWNWWRNQWHYRNEAFLNDEQIKFVGLPLQRLAYIGFNDGKDLTKLIRPTRIVYMRHLNTYKKAML